MFFTDFYALLSIKTEYNLLPYSGLCFNIKLNRNLHILTIDSCISRGRDHLADYISCFQSNELISVVNQEYTTCPEGSQHSSMGGHFYNTLKIVVK